MRKLEFLAEMSTYEPRCFPRGQWKRHDMPGICPQIPSTSVQSGSGRLVLSCRFSSRSVGQSGMC